VQAPPAGKHHRFYIASSGVFPSWRAVQHLAYALHYAVLSNQTPLTFWDAARTITQRFVYDLWIWRRRGHDGVTGGERARGG